MINEWKKLKTDEEVKIAWDPYRLRIMGVFRLSKEPLTVKQVADKMGEVPSKVHYHVQKLIKIDMLELVKTKVIRGIVAKYYTNKYSGSDITPTVSDKIVVEYTRNAHYNNFHQALTFFGNSMAMTDQIMKTRADIKFVDSITGFSKMYLSEKERDEFEQYMINAMKKFKNPEEGKKEYGFMGGLTRRK
jgi:predicted transcriptional regulator